MKLIPLKIGETIPHNCVFIDDGKEFRPHLGKILGAVVVGLEVKKEGSFFKEVSSPFDDNMEEHESFD